MSFSKGYGLITTFSRAFSCCLHQNITPLLNQNTLLSDIFWLYDKQAICISSNHVDFHMQNVRKQNIAIQRVLCWTWCSLWLTGRGDELDMKTKCSLFHVFYSWLSATDASTSYSHVLNQVTCCMFVTFENLSKCICSACWKEEITPMQIRFIFYRHKQLYWTQTTHTFLWEDTQCFWNSNKQPFDDTRT